VDHADVLRLLLEIDFARHGPRVSPAGEGVWRRITSLDTKAASAISGVRLVLTHETIGAAKPHGGVRWDPVLYGGTVTFDTD
jgi:hypothetical protein